MFSMTLANIICMLFNLKLSTLRPYKPNFKGCHKIGKVYQIKKGMFDKTYCFKIVITNRYFVNINALSKEDYKQLGYKSKEEYLKEDFNKNNASNLRIRYDYQIIEVNEDRINELIQIGD